MAKQTEIAYEPTKEWQDFQTGGTRIDAVDLNNMEQGISDACAAVDELRTKRLPTYLVAQDGDTATQDVYQEAILGPCLIVDLSTATTYYDNGEDGETHERTKLTSGADIDDLRDSLSQVIVEGFTTSIGSHTIDCNAKWVPSTGEMMIAVPISSVGASITFSASSGIYIGSVVITAPDGWLFSSSLAASIVACTRNGAAWIRNVVASTSAITIVLASASSSPEQPYTIMVRVVCTHK